MDRPRRLSLVLLLLGLLFAVPAKLVDLECALGSGCCPCAAESHPDDCSPSVDLATASPSVPPPLPGGQTAPEMSTVPRLQAEASPLPREPLLIRPSGPRAPPQPVLA